MKLGKKILAGVAGVAGVAAAVVAAPIVLPAVAATAAGGAAAAAAATSAGVAGTAATAAGIAGTAVVANKSVEKAKEAKKKKEDNIRQEGFKAGENRVKAEYNAKINKANEELKKAKENENTVRKVVKEYDDLENTIIALHMVGISMSKSSGSMTQEDKDLIEYYVGKTTGKVIPSHIIKKIETLYRDKSITFNTALGFILGLNSSLKVKLKPEIEELMVLLCEINPKRNDYLQAWKSINIA